MNDNTQTHPPRVLRLLHSFDPADTTTKFVTGLFERWPTSRLTEVASEASPTSPDSAAVARSRTRDALVRARPRSVPSLSRANSTSPNPATLSAQTTRTARLLTDAGLLLELLPKRLSKPDKERLDAFMPDLVYSPLGSIPAMRLACQLADRWHIPLVPHFMDDWIDTLYLNGELRGRAQRLAMRHLERCMERAPLALTIGDAMAVEFQERLGVRCVGIGNSVEFGPYPVWEPTESVKARVLTYAGSLNLGRADTLAHVARTIAASPDLRDWVIHLWTSPRYADRAKSLQAQNPRMLHRGFSDPAHLRDALGRSDALLFAESFEPDVLRYTRLSVSSKVPEYLATARPVITIGPEEQGSIREFSRLSGRIASAGQPSEIPEALLSGLKLAANGWKADQASWSSWQAVYGRAAVETRLAAALDQATAL